MSHNSDEFVFYDGMSDEELDKLLQISLGLDEDKPESKPNHNLNVSSNNNDDIDSTDLLTLINETDLNLSISDGSTQPLSSNDPINSHQTAVCAQNNSHAPELIIDDDMDNSSEEILDLDGDLNSAFNLEDDVANFDTQKMTNFDIKEDSNVEENPTFKTDIDDEALLIDDETLFDGSLNTDNDNINDTKDIKKEFTHNQEKLSKPQNNKDGYEWDSLLSDIEIVDEHSEAQSDEHNLHYQDQYTTPKPIQHPPINTPLDDVKQPIIESEQVVSDNTTSGEQNPSNTNKEPILNTESETKYTEDNLGTSEPTSIGQTSSIHSIKIEVQQLKNKISTLTQQFQQLSDESLQLASNLRQFQQESDDDFSATYQQMHELRKHIVTSRQKAEALPSLLELTEETLEADLYVAEIKKKH